MLGITMYDDSCDLSTVGEGEISSICKYTINNVVYTMKIQLL